MSCTSYIATPLTVDESFVAPETNTTI